MRLRISTPPITPPAIAPANLGFDTILDDDAVEEGSLSADGAGATKPGFSDKLAKAAR